MECNKGSCFTAQVANQGLNWDAKGLKVFNNPSPKYPPP